MNVTHICGHTSMAWGALKLEGEEREKELRRLAGTLCGICVLKRMGPPSQPDGQLISWTGGTMSDRDEHAIDIYMKLYQRAMLLAKRRDHFQRALKRIADLEETASVLYPIEIAREALREEPKE